MKFILFVAGIGLAAFFVQTIGPWWSGIVVAGIGAAIIQFKPGIAFIGGFLGVGIAWLVEALVIDAQNTGVLTPRIAAMLGDIPVWSLFVITALIGGIVGGMGSLTTALGIRWWFSKK